MERSFGLFDELFGTTSQNECACLGLWASTKYIESITTDLLLFKEGTFAKDRLIHSFDGGDDRATAGLLGPLQILFSHTTGTEEATIRKVLRGNIANRQSAEHNLGATVVNLLQFIVQNLPLGVDNILVLVDAVHADLGVVAFRLELEFDVEESDQWALIGLDHHLEASVREGLFEGNAGDEL